MSKFGEVSIWQIAIKNGEAVGLREAAIPLWKSIVIKHYLGAENFRSFTLDVNSERYDVIFDSDKMSGGNFIIITKVAIDRCVDIGKPDNEIIKTALKLLKERTKSLI